MAKRPKSATESKSESAAGPKPKGGGMRILTFLLALYAAVMGTLAFSKGGSGATKEAGKDGMDVRFASESRQIRSDVQADIKDGLAKAKELCALEAKKVATEVAIARTMKDAIVGQGEAAAQAFAKRSEVLDAKIDDAAKESTLLKETVATLGVDIRDLKSRPVAASGHGQPPKDPDDSPVPAKPVPPIPGPEKPVDEKPAKTPEEIAADKAKVRALIADLLAGLAANDVEKVFSTCLKLANMGDLEAVPSLTRVLKEFKDPYGRTSAANALGRLHACDAIPALIVAIGDKDNTVSVTACKAITAITGFDMKISGDPSRKEKNEAKELCTKWWKENESKVRERLDQPVGGAPPPPPPGGDPAKPPADGDKPDAGMADGVK